MVFLVASVIVVTGEARWLTPLRDDWGSGPAWKPRGWFMLCGFSPDTTEGLNELSDKGGVEKYGSLIF
jgi:hypothetical protein